MMQFDLPKLVAEIRGRKAKTVAIQAPEGMKQQLLSLASEIEQKADIKTIIFVEPCFGACDAKDEEAKALGADLLVHFGHLQFSPKQSLPTIFVPLSFKGEQAVPVLAGKIAAELGKKKIKKIALCATAQFLPLLALVEKELEKKSFSVSVGKGKNVEEGQVLGCNYSCVKEVEKQAEAIVFLGDGLFHPIGLGFCTGKQVFSADPIQGEVKEIALQKDLFLRRRIAMIEKARQAKTIAIWISTKKGQEKAGLALRLKEKLEKKGKQVLLIASDFIRPEYIEGMGAGAVVCTACPRIALDDSSLFKQPVINPSEALIMLGEKKIEEYGFEGAF